MVEKSILWKWCVQGIETREAEVCSDGAIQHSRCPKMDLLFISLIAIIRAATFLFCHSPLPLCFLTYFSLTVSLAISLAVFGVNFSRTWLLKSLPANETIPPL